MRKGFFATLLLIYSFVGAQAPLQVGDKVNYIDSLGDVVNAGMFKRGTAFSEGFAAVDVSHAGEQAKWFFIGEDFTVKIPYGYDTVGLFNGGLCPVKKGDAWFYIGNKGLVQIEAAFLEAGNFHEGIASVKDENGVFLIDEKGERITATYFDEISSLEDSVFGAKAKGNEYWSLYHLNGKVILQDSFYYLEPSPNGLVCVNRLGGYRFLNRKGELQFGRAYLDARAFSEGLACVRMEKNWVFIDEQGKVQGKTELKQGVILSGALTPAMNYNGKWGLLNRKGIWVTHPF